MNVEEDWTLSDHPRVKLAGSLVQEHVPRLRKRLLGIVRRRNVRNFDLHLSDIAKIDTAGVAVLVELLRHLVLRHGTLRVVQPSHCVERMLHLTRLQDVLTNG